MKEPYPKEKKFHAPSKSAESLHEQHVIYLENGSHVDTVVLASIDAADLLDGLTQTSDRLLKKKETAFAYQDACASDRKKSEPDAKAKCKPLGKRLISHLDSDLDMIRTEYPEHRFHPQLKVLIDALERGQQFRREAISSTHRSLTHSELEALSRVAAQWVMIWAIEASRQRSYKVECERLVHAAWARSDSMKGLLDHMFKMRSRVLSVRVDLRYRHIEQGQRHDPSMPGHPNLDEVEAHQAHFCELLRKRLLVDVFHKYLMRLEWAPRTGFHFHVMVLVEGRMRKDGIALGREIGRVWDGEVTKGQGLSFNCNLHAARGGYRTRGTGMFDRDDREGRQNLIKAASYLCKAECFVNYYRRDGGRTFFRSEVPAVR